VTVQGDPASTPASLPQLGDLTIAVSGVTLTNLNLHNVTINATFNHTTIASSLAAQIQDMGGSGNGFTILRNNVITNAAALSGNTAGATNDFVEGNVFARQTNGGFVETLGVGSANGSVIQGNTMTVPANGLDGIGVAGSTGVIIRNNTVRVNGGSVGGIVVGYVVNGGVSTSVTIADNVVQTGSSNGILLFKGFTSSPLSVSLSGNDLVNNKVGVSINGDGTSVGTVDLGGGSLGSAGNNDFHLFNGAAGHFAIQTSSAAGDTIQAQNNLFSGSPAAAISAPGETVNATALSANAAFIQRLYADYLHRAASAAEVAAWLPLLPNGRQAVVNGIAGSPEADTVLVEGLYERLLGRSASGDMAAAGLVQMLQNGATQEQVIAIVSTTELYNRANGLVNAGTPDQRFVISLYHLLLGRQRDPSPGEVSGWVAALPALGRAGVAQALLSSAEYRTLAVRGLYFTDPTQGSSGALPSIPAQWVGSTLPDMLHRSAAPAAAEVQGWVNSGMDLLSIEASIALSDEFFNNG
jgi:hypothetical protein